MLGKLGGNHLWFFSLVFSSVPEQVPFCCIFFTSFPPHLPIPPIAPHISLFFPLFPASLLRFFRGPVASWWVGLQAVGVAFLWRTMPIATLTAGLAQLCVFRSDETRPGVGGRGGIQRPGVVDHTHTLAAISATKHPHACRCNVLLIQKSILRDAVTETSLHFLAKMKIMVVRDVERTDVEFICKVMPLMSRRRKGRGRGSGALDRY